MNNSSRIELEIQQLLKNTTSHEVARELIKKFDWNALKKEDFRSLFHFYIISGQTTILISHLKKIIKKSTPVPWDLMLHTLTHFYSGFNQSHFTVLQAAAENQDATNELALYPEISNFSSSLEKSRRDLIYLQNEKVEEKKRELFILLDLFNSQELLEKASELLQKIMDFFPDDKEVLKRNQKLKESKVSSYFESQLSQRRKKYFAKPAHSAEDSLLLEGIAASMLDILKQEPTLQNDFIAALMMLDAPEFARSIISNSLQTNVWMHIEVLMACHRYLDVLKILEQKKSDFKNNPEQTLASFYCKAQALWSLDEKAQAIEILEAITMDHPDYRFAASLLNQWRMELE